MQEFWKDGSHAGAGRLGQGMSIVCICEDEASEPFVGNGRWNFSCSDADGYRIEFESLTDTPEETTLSEFESHGGS